jgi:hypothetical protein
MQKQRNREAADKAAAEKLKNQKYKDRIRELELKLRNYKESNPHLSLTKSPNGKEIEFNQSKMENIEIQNDLLQRKVESYTRKLKSSKVIYLNEIKTLKRENETLEMLLRDKDKECRLLALKLKELNRLGKFGKLKPLDFDLVNTNILTNRAQSSMRNQNETFNPKQKLSSKRLNKKDIENTEKPKKNKLTISKLFNDHRNNISLDVTNHRRNKSMMVGEDEGDKNNTKVPESIPNSDDENKGVDEEDELKSYSIKNGHAKDSKHINSEHEKSDVNKDLEVSSRKEETNNIMNSISRDVKKSPVDIKLITKGLKAVKHISEATNEPKEKPKLEEVEVDEEAEEEEEEEEEDASHIGNKI